MRADQASVVDPVTHGDLQDELQRLREAIFLLTNRLGPNLIDRASARRLTELLAPPWERPA